MKTVYVTVHGIRLKASDPMKPLADALAAREPDAVVVGVKYGYVLIPVTNRQAVYAVVNAVEAVVATHPGARVVVVGYSNGAWAAVQAAELGTRVDDLVLVSPALHVCHAMPDHVRSVTVFYCDTDWATWFGRLWRKLVNWLPWRWRRPHAWGAMGRYGYRGVDNRVTNYELDKKAGHTFYKYADVVAYIASRITARR